MVVRKRTTKKIGPYTRMTTTYSKGGGVTRSISNKPPGSPTRRTSTFNNKTGRSSVTHSTKLGGGYYDIRTKSTSPKKWKPSKGLFGGGRSRKRRETAGDYEVGESSLFWVLLGIVFLPLMVLIWCWRVNMWFGAVVTVVLYAWIFGWPPW